MISCFIGRGSPMSAFAKVMQWLTPRCFILGVFSDSWWGDVSSVAD
jgi:hypothetical protein